MLCPRNKKSQLFAFSAKISDSDLFLKSSETLKWQLDHVQIQLEEGLSDRTWIGLLEAQVTNGDRSSEPHDLCHSIQTHKAEDDTPWTCRRSATQRICGPQLELTVAHEEVIVTKKKLPVMNRRAGFVLLTLCKTRHYRRENVRSIVERRMKFLQANKTHPRGNKEQTKRNAKSIHVHVYFWSIHSSSTKTLCLVYGVQYDVGCLVSPR